MLVTLNYDQKSYQADLKKPVDISIPLRPGKRNVNAFYIPPMVIEPFRAGSFVGDVNQGGSCNVFDIRFNPHGNGTHTETVGHILKDKYPINKQLIEFFFIARLITIEPVQKGGDKVITKDQLEEALKGDRPEALIIRTVPNTTEKIDFQYSGTNPVYLQEAAARLICEKKIQHLLVDFPSVDREEDDGKLLAHKAFWNTSEEIRIHSTITELIFVPEKTVDGWYLLNLQTASFENDASPSKPVIFKMEVVD